MNQYGPGDEQTWPPYAGHPHDPRGGEPDDPEVEALAEEVESHLFDGTQEYWHKYNWVDQESTTRAAIDAIPIGAIVSAMKSAETLAALIHTARQAECKRVACEIAEKEIELRRIEEGDES